MPPPIVRGVERAAAPARTILLVWLLLTALTSALLLRAEFRGPPGYRFLGTFYFVGDFYNYLSYAQQAEDGAFLLRNKLASKDQPPVLFNLEWWLVGRLSALLGRRPVLAYHVFGAAMGLAFVALAEQWLRRAGLPDASRAAALILVFTGSGAGGLLFVLGKLPHALDLRTGLFPFVEVLSNPHFVAGTTLLMGALLAYSLSRPVVGALLGTALAFVRPYDLGLLLAARTGAILLSEPPSTWRGRLASLLGLLPALGYDAWVFFGNSAFRIFSSPQYLKALPPLVDVVFALGPATILAALAWPRVGVDPHERCIRLHLAVWAALALALAAGRPFSFAPQFTVGVGFPLLALAAVGIAKWGSSALPIAAALLSPTALAAGWLFLHDSLDWYVPAPRLEAALALRGDCRPGDLVLAPPDLGLYVGGLSPCWPFVSHAFAPDHAEKEATVRFFYLEARPQERAALLERIRPAKVVVFPAQEGVSPGWLGSGAPYEPERTVGRGPWAVEVWARRGDPPPAGPGKP